MPYILDDLVINRVDLVDEGANSAAFIELYKRKEQSKMEVSEILSKMKPEHASVLQEAIDKAASDLATVTAERDAAVTERDKANDDLAKANSELETLKAKHTCEACGAALEADGSCPECGTSKSAAFDETETIKSMPEGARAIFEKMKAQKDAAEEELRKAKEVEKTNEAIAKAKELKAIPVEQEKLVGIIKNASPEVLEVLAAASAAIEGMVLTEVGKSNPGPSGADAWAKIEAKADEITKRDSVTKAKAITVAIKENPDLYKEYLQGGAK